LQQAFDVACVSPIYTVFECSGSVLPAFLYPVLKSPSLVAKYRLHEQASVDRRGAVRFRDFAKIRIKIPHSLNEQRRIAEILDCMDDQIKAEAELLAKVRAMHKGILYDVMTRGVSGSGASWSSVPCKAVFSLASGLPYALAQPGGDSTFPIYGSSGPAGLGRKALSSGPTFVIGRVGEGGVGSVYYLPEPSWITDNALWARRIDPDWLPEFIAEYLSWLDLRRLRSQTGQPLVTQGVIGECPLVKPDLNEQRAIVEILREWSSYECTIEKRLGKLRLLKQGLMDDLLTGRVRVTGGGVERVEAG
jgi:type I restriction enzyme S subunit